MKNFKIKDGPFLLAHNNVNLMMKRFIISFIPLIILYFYQNGIVLFYLRKVNFLGLFYPLIFVTLPAFIFYLVDLLFERFIIQKKYDDLKYYIKNSSYFIYGLVLGVIMPIHTPIILLCLGAFISSFLGKIIYLVIGRNIFNPTLIGEFFIVLIYSFIVDDYNGYLSFYDSNFIISLIVCLFIFIGLTMLKNIKWRIPILYISTICLLCFVISLFWNIRLLFEIMSRGLLIGSVFISTDSVTSPVTSTGQVIYGICLGILTIFLYCFFPNINIIFNSILIMNLFVPVVDKIGNCAKFNKNIILLSLFSLLFTSVVIIYIIGL